MTGGCRVAILDSGINATHPHVGAVIGGVGVGAGGFTDDYQDLLGHGTAVAGAIHEKAPRAGILAVKIFDRSLSTSIGQLVAGLEWALDHCADVINLSLGTSNPAHREKLEPVIDRALRAGCRVVSARTIGGTASYPGSMTGVIGVRADAGLPRHRVRFDGDCAIAAPYPRPIPGVPRERNLSGISFAVANVSGYLCSRLQASGRPAVETAIRTRREAR